MAGNHTLTTNFNINVLINTLGMERISNTSMFRKKGFFILSPSVQNTANWFDLRKINLDKYDKNVGKGYLLVRFRNKFLLTSLDSFITIMISNDKYSDTANSGVHWQFLIRPNTENTFKIINRHDKSEVTLQETNIEDLIEGFNSK